MPTEVALQTLRERRRSLTWWLLGVVALVGLNVAFYPSVRDSTGLSDYSKDLPEAMRALFAGGELDLVSATGYLNSQIFALMAPLVADHLLDRRRRGRGRGRGGARNARPAARPSGHADRVRAAEVRGSRARRAGARGRPAGHRRARLVDRRPRDRVRKARRRRGGGDACWHCSSAAWRSRSARSGRGEDARSRSRPPSRSRPGCSTASARRSISSTRGGPFRPTTRRSGRARFGTASNWAAGPCCSALIARLRRRRRARPAAP